MITASSPDKNSRKNKLRQDKNVIKFAQEFFMIRVEGLIRNIHSSVSDIIKITSNQKNITIEFELYRMYVVIKHNTRNKISDIVDLDYMEEAWELTINSSVHLPSKHWYQSNNVLTIKDSLENIILLLSQDSIKELTELNVFEINTLDGMIKDNERTIQWYKSENEKFAQDRVKLDIEIAMKMKDTYETFRHRPSENKSSKSLTTGEEGIPKT